MQTTTLWQVDKSCCNFANNFVIKIDLIQETKKGRYVIIYPFTGDIIRVYPETTKHILLTTEKALKWLEYTLSNYAYDSHFWQQTTAKIEQIKAEKQAEKEYIENVHNYQRYVKSTHFEYHYQ